MYNNVLIILTNNLVKSDIMFMSNCTNMQYDKKIVFSRRLKLVRLSQILMTVGKLFHRDVEATANEQSPALVRIRFTSNMLWATHNQPGRRVMYSL